jgi:hypothetical protein
VSLTPRQSCSAPWAAATRRAIAFGFQVVPGTLVNAILNPGPLSIHDREMEERLGHCLLLLPQAEMTAPTVRPSRGRSKCRPQQALQFGLKMPLLPRLPRPGPSE